MPPPRKTDCGWCKIPLELPLSIEDLVTRFPDVKPDRKTDRTIARCKRCDMLLAMRRSGDIDLPPPNHTNPITELEKEIKEILEADPGQYDREVIEMIVDELRKKRALMVVQRDLAVRRVWMRFWTVWGKLPGQQDV